MTTVTKQQSLDLTTSDWLSPDYFVVHSGVASAIDQLRSQSEVGFLLRGPAGSGKSHLLAYLGHVYPDRFIYFDWSNCDIMGDPARDEEIRRFIAAFEDRKKGGLEILVIDPIDSPHIQSRLSHFSEIAIALPQDDELFPLVESILDRRNIRIEKRKLDRLINRLPANPLSLAEILTKIDDELASRNVNLSSNFHKFV